MAGQILGAGDVPIRPYLRIYGPISDPVVTFFPTGGTMSRVALTTRIDVGHFVGIDTAAHTAYLDDTGTSMLAELDWLNLQWPALPPRAPTTLQLTGSTTTHVSQVVATWRDGYLS